MAVSHIYLYIGAAIRRRRKELGMTQEQLASLMETSRASLANIEIGRQNVLVHQLFNFAASLNIQLEQLLPPAPVRRNLSSESELPLPKNLNPLQVKQISLLLGDKPRKVASPPKEKRNANQDKRRSKS